MKIKSDFVTNSSSSSFIVIFDRKPETVEEMTKILFGEEQEIYENPYPEYGVDGWPVEEVAKIVFEQTHQATDKELVDELYALLDGDYDNKEFQTGDGHIDWQKYHQYQDKKIKEYLERFKEENNGRFVSVYEYSDNDGELYSAMEHGDLFGRVKYTRISKH